MARWSAAISMNCILYLATLMVPASTWVRTHVRRGCRRSAPLILLAAAACSGPPDVHPSVGSATTADDPSAKFAQVVNGITAPTLASLIRSSRDQALQDGARSVPPQIRKAMRAHFEEELLDEVRWTTSSARPGLDTLLAGALEYEGAVTLGHVIVFFNEAAARNPKLWIHELHHVRQYREMGVDGFARAYVGRWRSIESEVEASTNRLFAALERSRSSQAAAQARRRTT